MDFSLVVAFGETSRREIAIGEKNRYHTNNSYPGGCGTTLTRHSSTCYEAVVPCWHLGGSICLTCHLFGQAQFGFQKAILSWCGPPRKGSGLNSKQHAKPWPTINNLVVHYLLSDNDTNNIVNNKVARCLVLWCGLCFIQL